MEEFRSVARVCSTPKQTDQKKQLAVFSAGPLKSHVYTHRGTQKGLGPACSNATCKLGIPLSAQRGSRRGDLFKLDQTINGATGNKMSLFVGVPIGRVA